MFSYEHPAQGPHSHQNDSQAGLQTLFCFPCNIIQGDSDGTAQKAGLDMSSFEKVDLTSLSP